MTIRLAVSCGDPQGIGPEVALVAARRLLAADRGVEIRLHGDLEGRTTGEDGALVREGRLILAPRPFDREAASPPPSAAGGAAALDALVAALAEVEAGAADALVTAPLSKEAVRSALPGFVGHTGFLGERAGVETLMLLATESLRVFLATDHVALRAVADALTPRRLDFVLATALSALRERYGIEEPRLAVLGLNPHAGEGGALGDEETLLVLPAIRRAGAEEAGVFGPFPADSFFSPAIRERYDGVVALYHDQGLGPLKALGFGAAVNVTLGLPYVRTSPDHGTAFDIAGRGRASSDSMLLALEEACRMVRGRS